MRASQRNYPHPQPPRALFNNVGKRLPIVPLFVPVSSGISVFNGGRKTSAPSREGGFTFYLYATVQNVKLCQKRKVEDVIEGLEPGYGAGNEVFRRDGRRGRGALYVLPLRYSSGRQM